MENMKELNLESMEQVTGGVQRIINTGKEGLNAAIRADSCKDSKQVASLANGTVINTISDRTVYDPVSGRNFVMITYTDKNGKQATGWVAASIVGLPR